jgi:hypothetical protein
VADLAKLVVRLEAQSAQLLTELEKANKKISSFERSTSSALDRVNKKFNAFGFGIKASIATFLGGISFKALIDANVKASETFSDLENAVTRAGDAAGGRSAKDFKDAATELSNITTQSGGAVQGVQQLLLRFQNIRTDRFDDATRAVLDFAQATKRDLGSAAELVGKALASPEKGMTALAKAGVIFSDAQQKVIKDLVDTGRRAEAQGIILDGLEKRFGGAAEAARNTFGGALQAVQNALGDLMESDGGLPEATKSMNELAKVLQDPAVKAGADALFSVIIRGAAAAAEFIAKLAGGLAVIAGFGQNEAVNLDDKIRQTSELLKHMKENTPIQVLVPGSFEAKQIEATTKKLKELQDQYDKLQGLGLAGAMNAKTGKGMLAKNGQAGAGAFQLPDIEVADQTEALDKLQKKLEAAGKALTDKLQTPYEKYTAAVAEADKLLAAHVITIDTWARALAQARKDLDDANLAMGTSLTLTLSLDEATRQLQEELKNKTNKDLQDSIDKAIDNTTEKTGKEFEKVLERSKDAWTVFQDQAARNMQDILADGIEQGLNEGFDNGLKGILDSFGKMLEKMAIQAVAADIAGKIFGTDPKGNPGGGGGLLDKAFEWIGKLFGGGGAKTGAGATSSGGGGGGLGDLVGTVLSFFGSMDGGGRGRAGEPVMIGVGAQPEMFVPDTAGQFYPADQWMGGRAANVTQNIYTQGPLTPHSARQLEIEAARRQRTAVSRLA